MRVAQRDEKHIRSTLGYIRSFATAGNFGVVADINADDVIRHANTLSENGKSSRTVQAILDRNQRFCESGSQ